MNFNRSSPKFEKLIPDFLKDYPDAKEELDPSFPKNFGPILQQKFLVDSDHAHDLVTRKYLICLLGNVVNTPSTWMSKCQVNITSSIYATEFSALRTATDEAYNLG